MNSVPDRCVIGVDIRTIPGQNHEEICQQLKGFLGSEADIELLNEVQSTATDEKNEWIQSVFKLVEPDLKTRPVAKGATFFTDTWCCHPHLVIRPPSSLDQESQKWLTKPMSFAIFQRLTKEWNIYTKIAE